MKTFKPCPLVLLVVFKNVLLPVNTLLLIGSARAMGSAPAPTHLAAAGPDLRPAAVLLSPAQSRT